ncbi:flagellar assembly protein FlgT [Rheinheimera sp. UJ51]|uniref:flagellar assembly protein T N-terminal domain-containing protein n=1 Tax=Rheinheimera sp. UJ51 TaxID=2892446 RepID=UPI001E3626AA|nr:flagellar assembly protein T N-terminal domain-containing protein [Rheinheimera sp. UJ51]MCC5450521.1 flagellar assembly protein FlgT [Rheinheimera sp. UJ51]
MRIRILSTLLFGLAALSQSSSLYANWYEATGQASIERGDLDSARRAAIEDALQRATLFAGAKLESQQQVVQGILQHHSVTLSTSAELRQVQLLSETHSQQQVFITLKAHILPMAKSCAANFRNPLLVTQVHLDARQDAIYGQLFELGEHSTRQLSRHLRDFGPGLALQVRDEPIAQSQLTANVADQFFAEGQQFILFATIQDLSLGDKISKFWQSSQRERFFTLEVVLFDTYERRVRYQQEYRTSSFWPDQDNTTPSSHSVAFWRMPYGQKIDQVLRTVAQDIQEQTQCQPLLAQIRQVKQQHIQLGLGSSHGLKVGDQVNLIQVQRDPQQADLRRLLDSPVQLTITDITPEGAWAASLSQQLLNHIQPGDIVSFQSR